MELTLRLENENDHKKVENLTRESFWNLFKSGCDEHFLLYNLRKSKDFIPQLDYVAILNNKIVGNIVYTTAKIEHSNGKTDEVLTFGPLSVLPSHQNQGIGAALITHTLKVAKEMGFKAVFIYGFSHYYSRFGFKNAKEYGVTTPDGQNFDDFMALELFDGALKNVGGKLILPNEYNDLDNNALEEYDKQFPFKEKGKPKFTF